VQNITKRAPAPTASWPPSVASHSTTDITESGSAVTMSADSFLPFVQDLQTGNMHQGDAKHDRRTSLEMQSSITTSGNIHLNFEGTPTKPHGRVHGTAVSNKARVNHGVSRRKT